MKNKCFIFFLSLLLVFFIGYIIGVSINANKLTSLQSENENLSAALIKSEEEIKVLQGIPKTQLVYKEFEIDGFRRNNSELVTAIKYNDELYVPLYFLSTERGETVKVYEDLIFIGESAAFEKLISINTDVDITNLDNILGKPNYTRTYEDVCTMSEVTIKEYDGVSVHGASITVVKPVLQTYRGITIGSTKEEVEKAYGKPNSYNSDISYYYYGVYYANLWFRFEDGIVKSFGILMDGC